MKTLSDYGAIALCILVFGCTTQTTTALWKQKARGLPVGTPRSQVEKVLPPSEPVYYVGSHAGAPHRIDYWVDSSTVVRCPYDGDDVLIRPIVVEVRERTKANK